MADIAKLGSMAQLRKGDRPMPASAMSDDSILVKKLLADHNPDGLEYDAKPLLHIVEDILRRATSSMEDISKGALAHDDVVEVVSHLPGYINMLEALSFKIDRISCEISYKSLGGVDAHTTTVAIFEMLTNYKWDVKLVVALAAFALTYGEFWLLAHIHETNPLAKSMAILKQVSGIMERANMLKPRFDALNELVKVMLDVVRCVVEFNDLPTQYITQEVSIYTTVSNHIPIAAYWTVRAIVACATQITSLSALGFEFLQSTTEAWELSTLAHKLRTILDHLRKNLDSCYKQIGRPLNK